MTSKRFLNQASLVWMLISFSLLAFRAHANSEAAATVLFTHGVVTLTTATGSHDLAKGDDVPAGSTINTADKSRAQLRFTDGGLVSLMPSTEFSVDSYNQPTADDEGSISMSLVKGGLRSLSGTIGKKNKESYELKTKVATLGIRGTQYVATYEGEVMRVHVGEGSVALTNEFGELVLNPGQSAVVFEGQAPQSTQVQPQVTSTAVEEDSADESDSEADSNNENSTSNSDSIADSNDTGVSGNTDSANSISHALPLTLVDEKAVEKVEKEVEEAAKPEEDDANKEGGEIFDEGEDKVIDGEEVKDPETNGPVVEPPVKKYVMAYYSSDSKYADNPSDTESNKPSAKEAAVLEALQSTFKNINESLELEGEGIDEFQVKVANGPNGSVTKVGNGLVWGEVDIQYQEEINGVLANLNERVFFVVAEHTNDLPATGILSYRLSDDPSHKSEVYTGDPDNQYTLQQLDLDLFIKSHSDVKANVALVIVEDDPQYPDPVSVAEMITFNPIDVAWSDDGGFKLNATEENGYCYPTSSCTLWLSGVLASDDQNHAGVTYKLVNEDANPTEHSGAAALELVPALERKVFYAAYDGGIGGMEVDGGISVLADASGMSDVGQFQGDSYAELQFIPNDPETTKVNLNHDGGLIWGEYSVFNSAMPGDWEKRFIAFGEQTTLPMSGGVLSYSLSKATAVYDSDSPIDSYTLDKLDLKLDLTAGSYEQVAASVDMQVTLLDTHQLIFKGNENISMFPYAGFQGNFEQDSNFSGCEGCNLNISGVLNGINHEQAGVVYQLQQEISGNSEIDSYVGAALLTRNP